MSPHLNLISSFTLFPLTDSQLAKFEELHLIDRKLINLVGELLAALRENSKFRSP